MLMGSPLFALLRSWSPAGAHPELKSRAMSLIMYKLHIEVTGKCGERLSFKSWEPESYPKPS